MNGFKREFVKLNNARKISDKVQKRKNIYFIMKKKK